MHLQEQGRLLLEQIAATGLLQWIAIAFSVAEVLLARGNKIALYPTGIIAVLLTIYILYQSGLYAECVLNAYYLVMSIYGWWHWIKKKHLPAVPVSYCNKRDWLITAGIVTVSFALFSVILKNFTPSTVPVWDAWVSATAWAGMWLLARRKIENWILLNISNVFAVPLLWYKHLPLYAGLTIFLFIVAIQGFFKWQNIIREQQSATYPVATSNPQLQS